MNDISTKTYINIPLSSGTFAIVDNNDYDWLSEFKWSAAVLRHTAYAYRSVRNDSGKRTTLLMHRAIFERHYGKIPEGLFVDHRDRNGINNRISNLRLCTHSQNMANGIKHKDAKTSLYKGVSFKLNQGLWQAQIGVNGCGIRLGTFSDEISAAKAYDRAAQMYFGEFSNINFPQEER